jgi:2-oxo-4-hydroxy-4-carboxy-5-ureidoimidazoline decarboxylase
VKEGVLRCHPDLAGRLAQTQALSAESTGEQQAAGLLHLNDEEKQILGRLNDAYKAKFGFPFIICVRQNKKEAIFRGIEQRLNNSREQELAAAVEEVKKIGTLRLNDILDKLADA